MCGISSLKVMGLWQLVGTLVALCTVVLQDQPVPRPYPQQLIYLQALVSLD